MSIENTRERKIRPTHPGEMLREEFLTDYGLTLSGLAKAIGVSRQTVNELLRERRAVTPEMALRLARLFGNTPEFWLNAQRAVDLWDAERTLRKNVNRITPLSAAWKQLGNRKTAANFCHRGRWPQPRYRDWNEAAARSQLSAFSLRNMCLQNAKNS
jgi:antitoxin HigA-1